MRQSTSIGRNFAERLGASRRFARPLWPAIFVLGAFAAGSPAQSEDGFLTWIVKSVAVEDDAIIEASLATPRAGTTLVQGQRISTGPGQQMVLTNGRDLVTLNPGTSVKIGDNDSSTADANLELRSGTVHVEAGKRTPGHTFSVEAPYLVATVKGTKFDVSTSTEASAVSVTEGVVGVASTTTRDSVDVTPGKTATVGRLSPNKPNLVDSPPGGATTIVNPDNTEMASSDADGGNGGGDSSGGAGSGGSGSSGGGSSGGGSSGGGSSGGDSSGGDSSGGDTASGGETASGGGSLGGAVGGAVGGATGAVGGAVSGATGAVGGAVSGATGAIGGAVGGPVGGAVSGVGGALGGAVSGVGGAVGGAVGGLGGAVGGLLGGGGRK